MPSDFLNWQSSMILTYVDAYIHCGMAHRLANDLDKATYYLHKALNLDKKCQSISRIGIYTSRTKRYCRERSSAFKVAQKFLHVGLIALLFPNAKIIHTRRNPIDTCLSIFFQNFNNAHPYAFNLENLGFHYQQYQRIMRHWHQVLPGRILDINYEDTIDDPEYWSRKLISHLGLEWDDACLAPHELERSVKTASQWQVRQLIYKTSVQRWKKYDAFLGALQAALGLTN